MPLRLLHLRTPVNRRAARARAAVPGWRTDGAIAGLCCPGAAAGRPSCLQVTMRCPEPVWACRGAIRARGASGRAAGGWCCARPARTVCGCLQLPGQSLNNPVACWMDSRGRLKLAVRGPGPVAKTALAQPRPPAARRMRPASNVPLRPPARTHRPSCLRPQMCRVRARVPAGCHWHGRRLMRAPLALPAPPPPPPPLPALPRTVHLPRPCVAAPQCLNAHPPTPLNGSMQLLDRTRGYTGPTAPPREAAPSLTPPGS